ncbi:hypothetical protein GGX14DRAFT_393290 [Mycena pura]|uniref:Uncharacterized protein n=1 Tax=Mycena pura TaxID=153505 RepID=A0AAD6VHH1_9AGAR|nr:hypothetical protein GGX14DRAFT_393290 [Mycena pura]
MLTSQRGGGDFLCPQVVPTFGLERERQAQSYVRSLLLECTLELVRMRDAEGLGRDINLPRQPQQSRNRAAPGPTPLRNSGKDVEVGHCGRSFLDGNLIYMAATRRDMAATWPHQCRSCVTLPQRPTQFVLVADKVILKGNFAEFSSGTTSKFKELIGEKKELLWAVTVLITVQRRGAENVNIVDMDGDDDADE